MNFFLSAHETFPRRDYILEHKSSLGKFKKIKIISSIFSNYNTMEVMEGETCGISLLRGGHH